MSFGRDRHETIDEQDDDTFEDEPSRSIFSATWFRALLVFIALAVIAVVALPYALEWANPPAKTRGIAKGARPPVTEAPTPPSAPVSGPVPVVVTPKADSAPPASGNATEPRVVSSIPGVSEAPPPATSAPHAQGAPADTARVPSAATPPPVTPPGAVGANEPPKALEPAGTTEHPKSAPPARSAETPRVAERPRTIDLPKTSDVPATTDSATALGARQAAEAAKVPEPSRPEGPRVAAVPRATENAKKNEAGPFWIQVGAFRDADTAKRVAEKLREEQFPVPEPERMAAAAPTVAKSEPASTPSADRYDVFVSGTAASELNTRLASRGVTADAVAGGAVLKPSQPLADAVALAKELSADGLRVQVRRASGTPRSAAATPATEGATLYRVRVGSYADRTTALAALHDLEAKGYKPFLARGAQ